MRFRSRLTILLAVVMIVGALPGPARAQSPGRYCPNVPGIPDCIEGRFLEYWTQNGELQVFGYPITPFSRMYIQDPDPASSGYRNAQWFERHRLEQHRDPRPYDVKLGRLGYDRLRSQGRQWETETMPGGIRSRPVKKAATWSGVRRR